MTCRNQAQPPSPDDRVRELEAENRELEAQVAALRHLVRHSANPYRYEFKVGIRWWGRGTKQEQTGLCKNIDEALDTAVARVRSEKEE